MVEQERVLVMVYSAGHQYHHTVSWNDTNVAFERIIYLWSQTFYQMTSFVSVFP